MEQLEGTTVTRCDSIPLSETHFTPEGYLIDNPILTRVGIFEYKNPDGTIRRELRLPEEVFAAQSLASYKGKPVILTHEAGLVNIDNVQQEHIGTILTEGVRDGDNVRAQIVIHDAESLEYGLRELSLGYTQTPEETPGVWNGQSYDAIQRNIQINHLALVEKARAGEKARLNIDGEENKQGGNKMSKARKDGLTPEEISKLVEEYKQRQAQRMGKANPTSDEEGDEENPNADEKEPGTEEGEKTIDEGENTDPVQQVKDRRDRRDSFGDCETMDEANGMIAQQDEDIQNLLDFIAQLQAKIDFDDAEKEKTIDEEEKTTDEEDESSENNHEEKLMSMDAVDTYVNQKIELIRLGDKLNIDSINNMKLFEAKKAIIRKVHPNIRLDGKDKAYINAMFDIAKEGIKKRKDVDYQRQQMFCKDGKETPLSKGGQYAARQRMIQNMGKGDRK